jgi:O-acetyl-ADP-ribose deacetylase (regulator of RNase III)
MRINIRNKNSSFKLTVVQGSIVNIKADAIVHPTNNSFFMGGDVGMYFFKIFFENLLFFI